MKHPLRLLALDLDGTSLNTAKHITPAVLRPFWTPWPPESLSSRLPAAR